MPFEPRFRYAADAFERYRPDYPAALYARILEEIPSEHRGCAMDLGAGTGIVTAHLVPHFRQVIAVEPDATMAGKIAERFPRVIIRNTTAEQCREPAGSVDLVTIANALHWMDAPRVLANCAAWLRRNAILAVFDRPLPKAGPAIDAVVLAELRGPWKRHRDPRLKRDLLWQDQVRAASGFRIIEESRLENIVSSSASDYAGFWRSTSYGSAYAQTLAEPEAYWNGLESRLAAAAGAALISVDFTPTLMLAQRT